MRLINADELVKFLKKTGKFLKIEQDHKRVCHVIGRIIDYIEAMPTVDAVPVVRCKDCKHENVGLEISDKGTWCEYWGIDPDFNDFCSYGERREE